MLGNTHNTLGIGVARTSVRSRNGGGKKNQLRKIIARVLLIFLFGVIHVTRTVCEERYSLEQPPIA
jgi:hypothetical protein